MSHSYFIAWKIFELFEFRENLNLRACSKLSSSKTTVWIAAISRSFEFAQNRNALVNRRWAIFHNLHEILDMYFETRNSFTLRLPSKLFISKTNIWNIVIQCSLKRRQPGKSVKNQCTMVHNFQVIFWNTVWFLKIFPWSFLEIVLKSCLGFEAINSYAKTCILARLYRKRNTLFHTLHWKFFTLKVLLQNWKKSICFLRLTSTTCQFFFLNNYWLHCKQLVLLRKFAIYGSWEATYLSPFLCSINLASNICDFFWGSKISSPPPFFKDVFLKDYWLDVDYPLFIPELTWKLAEIPETHI